MSCLLETRVLRAVGVDDARKIAACHQHGELLRVALHNIHYHADLFLNGVGYGIVLDAGRLYLGVPDGQGDRLLRGAVAAGGIAAVVGG